MANLVLPRVQAMVTCDGAKESEQELDVFHLNAVRSVITAASFPAFVARLCVFLHMSGHHGEARCHIDVLRDETDELIYRTAPKPASFDSPTSVVPLVFRLRNCVFPSIGVYYVQIFHEGKLIGERPLYVRGED